MSLPRRVDVCNGDADGLCALVQLRLDRAASCAAGPSQGGDPLESPAELITGLKREIALLQRASQPQPLQLGDRVTVLDVSLAANRAALMDALQAGAQVRWFDHHDCDDIPRHPGLHAHINTQPGVCTSLLVDAWLQGRQRLWAVVGAYGDNLAGPATTLARGLGLSEAQCSALRELGEALNYNAYGDEPADVLIPPAQLAALLLRHAQPWGFLRDEPMAAQLVAQRAADLAQALAFAPGGSAAHDGPCAQGVDAPQGSVWVLPDAPWSRRVSGSLAHELASREPQRAHAVLRPAPPDRGTWAWLVHVRAPLSQPGGAAALCRRFGGDGRALAGGIDVLPDAQLPAFTEAFLQAHWG